MSKHRLQSPALPPPKRVHLSTNRPLSHPALSLHDSLYDELILCIFSHLSFADLCSAQATSKNWARLATDNELWRKLYLRVYGRTRLRGGKGFIGRSDGKEVKPLPARIFPADIKDWKWMFRISSNWRRGRCAVERLVGIRPSLPTPSCTAAYQTHVILSGPLTITASSCPADIPAIIIFRPSDKKDVLACESKHASSCHVTALAIDQSPPVSGQLRLASFLSTGEFSVFLINHARPSPPLHKLQYVPQRRTPRNAPIMQAVYHHPLLITLSETFTLSIYDLSSDTIRHSQSLSSFTSYPPMSLVLSTPTPSTYKLVLAYTIPVYPAHWSVGATELIISGPKMPEQSPSLSFHETTPDTEPMTVINTRTTRAINVPQGWIDEKKLRTMREQWGRKVSGVADTQTDGKWVVLAPGDHRGLASLLPSSSPNSATSSSSLSSDTYSSSSGISSSPYYSPVGLQLYRLSLPGSSGSVASSPPKLTFVRTLHGLNGPASAVAVADGRCVSLGLNGSIWIWDLESGTDAEVAGAVPLSANDLSITGLRKGSVAFDDRRIVTTNNDTVIVRRFDI